MPDQYSDLAYALSSRRRSPFDARRAFAQQLTQSGADMSPINHPLQGVARLAQALVGGWMAGNVEKDERDYYEKAKTEQKDKDTALVQALLGGGGSQPAQAGAPPSSGTPPSPAWTPDGPLAQRRDKFVEMMTPHALEVSRATGLDPRLVIAQSALETGYGGAAPGNNFFGIKSHGREGGQVLPTHEVGPKGSYQTKDSFRTYADPGASARDYAEFLKTNGRYGPMLAAQGLDAQIAALGKSGYATDPQYAEKVRSIANSLPMPAPQMAGGGDIPQGDNVPSGNVQQAQYSPQGGQPQGGDPGARYAAAAEQALAAGRPDIAKTLAMEAMKAREAMATRDANRSVQTVDLGDSVGIMDPRTGQITQRIPKNKQQTPPNLEARDLGDSIGFFDPRTGNLVRREPKDRLRQEGLDNVANQYGPTPGGQQPGQVTPPPQAALPQPPQGSVDPGVNTQPPPMQGAPPPPQAPQGMPAVQAQPPAIPQRMTFDTMPPEMKAPFLARYRSGGYGDHAAEADVRMRAHAQETLNSNFETDKMRYDQQSKLSEESRKPTEGQKAVDNAFGKDYAEWVAAGGSSDTQRQLVQLQDVVRNLQSGKNLTGPILGRLPDSVLSVTNPEAIATRNAIEEVVQRNLRIVLGSQFTAQEGENLIKRAYNPALGEAENAKRVGRLLEQIKTAVEIKSEAVRYFEQHGSLRGWSGRLPTIADFSVEDRNAPSQDNLKKKYGLE